MATINGSAAEPQATLTAPTVGGNTDTWGNVLNETTLQALLDYILWLKARVPATDPSGEADGRTLVVASGALVFGDAGSVSLALDDLTDVTTAGSSVGDVLADTGSGWAPLTLGSAAAADAGDFATAAQGTLADTAMQPGDPVSINAQTGTSYTLVLGDAGTLVTSDNGSAVSFTIPTNGTVAFDVGTVIAVAQLGAGTLTIQGDTGVTVNGVSAGSEALSAQYATASLVKVATDTWLVAGGLA